VSEYRQARLIGSAVALVLAVGMVALPPFRNDEIGGVSLNWLSIAVATALGLLLAPRLRGAPAAIALRTALVTLIVAIPVGDIAAAVLMTRNAGGSVLDALAVGFVGLVFVGLPMVVFGVPLTVAWALVVWWLLRVMPSSDIREH
jgi:hypothetical protein